MQCLSLARSEARALMFLSERTPKFQATPRHFEAKYKQSLPWLKSLSTKKETTLHYQIIMAPIQQENPASMGLLQAAGEFPGTKISFSYNNVL